MFVLGLYILHAMFIFYAEATTTTAPGSYVCVVILVTLNTRLPESEQTRVRARDGAKLEISPLPCGL